MKLILNMRTITLVMSYCSYTTKDLLCLREVCRDFEDAVENYIPNIWSRIYKELGHYSAWRIRIPYINRRFLQYMDNADENGETALTMLAGESQEKAIFLIKNGANVNHKTRGASDALTRCFHRRKTTMPVPLILLLLQKGFRMGRGDERVSIILRAVLDRSNKEELKQWEEIVFLLIERGCDVASDECMNFAVRNMSFELVKYLISKGVNPYSRYIRDLRCKLYQIATQDRRLCQSRLRS